MNHELTKKYGLFTAICMVAGIVIGSGVFFKAQSILILTGGNLSVGILAWVIGGVIMLVNVLAFACMAGKHEKVNGVVDYAEATVGKTYAYFVGWFISSVYYPTLTTVVAWLAARYTLVFLTSVNPAFPLVIPVAEGGCARGPECLALTMVYLCLCFFFNALTPKLAGKIQTSTTVIKLIPLVLMAIAGIVYGIATGNLGQNFSAGGSAVTGEPVGAMLLGAVCATAFAYDGWIIATSINAELKNAKRNLPIALIVGAGIVISVYLFYFIGVAGGAETGELIESGATVAFTNVFGNVVGNILNLFVAISCFGTANGLMLGCSRGMYSLAVRGEGFAAKTFRQVDRHTNMAHNSAIMALLFTVLWGFHFYLSQNSASPTSWLGVFAFDSSELPIVTLYLLYIPIFILWMVKTKDEGSVKRFVLPSFAIIGSSFMVFASIVAHGIDTVWYLIVFALIMFIGALPLIRARRTSASSEHEEC